MTKCGIPDTDYRGQCVQISRRGEFCSSTRGNNSKVGKWLVHFMSNKEASLSKVKEQVEGGWNNGREVAWAGSYRAYELW